MYNQSKNKNERNTKAMKNTQKKDFAQLLRRYENATRNRANNEAEFSEALQELANACAFSVLKKLCNVGGAVTEKTKTISDTAKKIRDVRRSLAKDLNALRSLDYSTNNATKLVPDENGRLKRKTTDKALKEASNKLAATALDGDGLDLTQTASLAILDETSKADKVGDFMETGYTVRRLKRKVYIKDINSLGGYETVTTTPIQEVYKAIRREIENGRTMQTASHKYTYLDEVLKDDDSDTETAVYKRLSTYSCLAYEMKDFNGKVIAITADSETDRQMCKLVAKLNLTMKQAKVLELRLSGYGYKAIATYLGVTPRAVAKTIEQIQKKAKDLE